MKKMNGALQRKVLCALLAVAAVGVSVNVEANTNYYVGGSTNYQISKTTDKDVKRGPESLEVNAQFAGLQIVDKGFRTSKDITVNLRGNVSIDITNTGSASNLAKGITAGIYSTITPSTKTSVKIASTLGSAGSTVDVKAKGNQYVSGIQLLGQNGYNGPQMTINGKSLNVTAESTGNYAHGIYVANTTTDLNEKLPTKLVINSDDTVINVKADTKEHEIGIATYSQGEVEINGNLEVNAANAIVTRGNSKITINKNGDKTVKINGDILFDYDGATSGTTADADLSLNLSNADSSFTGRVYVNGNPPTGKSEVDGMTMGISNGATWNMTGDSFVNAATVEDGGAINVGEDVNTFTADAMTLTGGTLNAEGGETTITTLKADKDSTVSLSNATLNVAGGEATIGTFNAEGSSVLNLSNTAKVDIAGGNANLDTITTSNSSVLGFGSGAHVKATKIEAKNTSQVNLAAGSEVEADLYLGDSSTASIKGSLKGQLRKSDTEALSETEIANILGVDITSELPDYTELKKDKHHVKMMVDKDGNFIIQSTDLTNVSDGSVNVSALGTWDSNGNYTASGDYNANGHHIYNVSNLSAKSITLNGTDLQTEMDTRTNNLIGAIQQTATNLESNLEGVQSNIEKNLKSVETMAQNGLDTANQKIDTNAGNIEQNKQDIAANKENIEKNTAAIAQNAEKIADNAQAISDETAAREAGDAAIKTEMDNRTVSLLNTIQQTSDNLVKNIQDSNAANAQNLQNVSDMAQNGLDKANQKIDTNAGNIEQNKQDIAANKENIEKNATAIAQNAENIAANKQAIADEATAREAADAEIRKDLDKKATKEELVNATSAMASQLGNAINGVQDQVNAQGVQIEGLNKDVAGLKDKDTELQTNIDNEATARAAKDTELEKAIGENAGNISKNAADIAENRVQIANNKAAITDNKNAIAENKTAIAKNADAIAQETTERKADVSTLSGRIDANDASISTLNRQLHDVGKEVDTVGALSMAMAGLHPLEYDSNGANFQLAAAVGNYDGTQALALGGFYHFNRDSMLSVGLATDLGADTHKFGANLGYTIRVGHAAEVRRPSEGTVSDILKDIQELKAKQAQLEKENEELKAQLAALGK